MSGTVPTASTGDAASESDRAGSAGATARAARRRASSCSVLSVAPPDRREELLRIEANAVLEHDLDVLDVGDPGRRVALDHDQVGVLADGDAADAVLAAEVLRAVERRDLDRLDRREPALDQELDLALVAEAGEHAAVAGRIGAGDQEAAGGDERALERHVAAQPLGGLTAARRIGPAKDQIRLARLRRHRVEQLLAQR